MYAIIECGGKQHKVSVNDVIEVELINSPQGEKLTFDSLFTADGTRVETAPKTKVTAEIVGNYKGKKVIVYKYKAKKNIRRKQGHRQKFTKIKILSIE